MKGVNVLSILIIGGVYPRFEKLSDKMKNRIKELRKINKLTQDDLAIKLGVSRQTIISLEKGKYNPSINLAFKISMIFGKIIEEIFVYEEE